MAYHLYKPHSARALMVNTKHLQLLNNHDDDRCLRLGFIEDFTHDIQKGKDLRVQIIIMIDANEDIRCGAVQ